MRQKTDWTLPSMILAVSTTIFAAVESPCVSFPLNCKQAHSTSNTSATGSGMYQPTQAFSSMPLLILSCLRPILGLSKSIIICSV